MDFKYIIFAPLILFSMSCSEDFTEEKPDIQISEQLFMNVLVVGDYMTTGVMDGSISTEGQNNNFLTLFFNHINQLTGNKYNFHLPDMVGSVGYSPEEFRLEQDLTGKIRLVYKQKGNSKRPFNRNAILPVPNQDTGEELQSSSHDFLNLNNVSIPNFTSALLADPEVKSNIYLESMNFNNGTITESIVKKKPSLLLLNIGQYEILKLALQGGKGNGNDQYLLSKFEENMGGLLQTLSTENYPIVICTIPDITNFPYFTQAHYNIYLNGAESGHLTTFHSDFNRAVSVWNYEHPDARRKIVDYDVYSQLTNGWLITDNHLPEAFYQDGREMDKKRQMTVDDAIFFPLYDRLETYGYGTVNAIEDDYSLTVNELSEIKQLVRSYNNVIYRFESVYKNIQVFDVFQIYENILKSIEVDEGIYKNLYYVDNSILLGGIFSSDGITFNPRGHAILATDFVEFINTNNNQIIPEIDVSTYRGNTYVTEYE